MGEGCTCFEPENIMCSKRCANPLRPGVWLAAPTWYQTSTATCGSRWSSLRITVSPFGSTYFSNLISGSAAAAAKDAASARVGMATRLRMSTPGNGEAGARIGRILGDLGAEPGRAIEVLALRLKLDLGEPEIAMAEMVEHEAAHRAP